MQLRRGKFGNILFYVSVTDDGSNVDVWSFDELKEVVADFINQSQPLPSVNQNDLPQP
jgi:hypothetical protein